MVNIRGFSDVPLIVDVLHQVWKFARFWNLFWWSIAVFFWDCMKRISRTRTQFRLYFNSCTNFATMLVAIQMGFKQHTSSELCNFEVNKRYSWYHQKVWYDYENELSSENVKCLLQKLMTLEVVKNVQRYLYIIERLSWPSVANSLQFIDHFTVGFLERKNVYRN